MRVLLAISVIYHTIIAQQVGINAPCNKEFDGLLTADPDGNERAFMSCQGVGVGSIGFWERKFCPNNMVFDFINQQCKDQKKKARKQQTLSIAILNNSCANGETCIGGSVCDLDTLRCMCPYGTTPKLDTLSCESSQPAFVSATVDGPSQFFNSLSGANGNKNNYKNEQNFMPFGQTPDFLPNNNFKFNNLENNQKLNNNNNNNNEQFNWNPNFNWNNNGNVNKQSNMNNGAGTLDFSNPFQPNPNQKFVFNFNKNMEVPTSLPTVNNNNNNQNVPIVEAKPKVTTLAIPGASCKSNEICVGGSICTLPIGICLCPGDLEARDGECVLPASSTISVQKVGIGALCSDLAECDHGSTCIMGRCTCVSPLVQHEGKCVLRQQQKVVGPGELCDNGEICGRGSVCDVMIPVCVCPAHTDLSNGECVSMSTVTQSEMLTQPPTLPPVQIPVQTMPPPTRPPPPPPVQVTQPPPTVQQVFFQTTPPPLPAIPRAQTFATTQATTQFIPKQIYTAAPQMPKSSVKVNQMKIGGSKQAGVGVRCSLNTDCMIGAYCNGNTSPPSCQCLSTHVNVEGRCEKVIYPGQVGCRSDLQCHAALSGTHCTDRICVCPEGQKAVDQICVSGTSPPNQHCGYSSTNPCSNQSVCFHDMCICPDRYSHNSSTHSCNVTIPEHTECSKACFYPRACVNNTCICPDNVDCRRQLKIRAKRHPEGCSKHAEICKSRNAVCVNGICQCAYGFHESYGNCAPDNPNPALTNNEINCSNAMDCPIHHSCDSGKCRCETNEFDIVGNCLPPLFYGAFKNINNQCTAKDRCSGGSKCKDSLCQCVDGAIEITGKCKQFPGGRCSNGEMCSGGSSCYLGKCRCDPSWTLDNQRCVRTAAPIGSTCRKGQKCVNGAACRFGMCMCVSKTVAVLGRCVAEAEAVDSNFQQSEQISISTLGENKKPGMSCEARDTCIGESSCKHGVCFCDLGLILVDEKCISPSPEPPTEPPREPETTNLKNDECTSDNDCSEIEQCLNSKCQCVFGFKSDGNVCQQDKSLLALHPGKSAPGSLCNSSSECSFRTKCIEGVCRCKKGETIIDSTCRSAIHHVLPGLACDPTNGYDCVGEAICQYGACKCQRRLVSDGQKCVPLSVAVMVAPGKSCANGEPCGGGSSCAKNGICQCAHGRVADVNKKCVKKDTVFSVFNKIKSSTETPTTTVTFPTTTTTTIDNEYIQKKIDELEKIEMEFKNTLPTESSLPAVHRPSSSILAGHQCTQNSECPSFSFCFANSCNCMIGFRATSGICEPAIAVGESCITSNQCFDDSECVFGVCTCTGPNCKDGKMAHPGEECTEVKVVCSYNSYCSLMSGVCECPSGMATKGRSCENTFESIGKDCVTSRNCQKSSYCDNGYCVCKTGHKISDSMCLNSPSETKTFEITPFDKNVGENTPLQNTLKNEFRGLQEMSNEGIFYTTTKWPEILSFTMIPPAPEQNYNQPNTQFPQVFSSFPIAYGAKTVAEEENNSTMKYKIAFPGEYCGQGEVCLGNSVCEDHFCRCLQDVTAENGLCPTQVDDLRLLGLQPLDREFRFAQGKKIEMRRTSSLPLENCQNEETCENNSTCQSILGLGKICQCTEHTVLWNDECIEVDDSYDLVEIEGTCNDDSLCLSGSKCVSGKCLCSNDKRLILGICVLVALPETSCENGEVCINGSVCGDSSCECTNDTYNDNGNCVSGQTTKKSEQNDANSLEENETESEEGEGDEEKENNKVTGNRLRNLVRRELSTIDCSNDTDCQPNFKCQEYVCICDGPTEDCLSSIIDLHVLVPPGSGCNTNRKCANDSICYKDYCVCSYEDMPEDDQCVARDWHIGLGSQCTDLTRCREDLQCVGGICMCKFGDLNCNPSEPVTSPPGGSCSNLRECTGGSVCKEGWCICPDSSMIVNRGICIQSGPKPTLPPRTSIPQVPLPPQLPISVNVPQVTITKAQPFVTDAPPQGKKIVPGGRCGPIDVCVGGSNCIQGLCLCPAGQQPSNTGRCEKFTTTPRQTTFTTTQGTTAPPPTSSVFTSAFTIADLFSTRRPPAFIEIPTHEPLTTTQNIQIEDECTAIGLICKGNTVCRNKSCQCPEGHVLHHDGCVSPEEAARRKARGKARHEGLK
uniref:EGF-like domain-containing protein n=1 Tax=Caenorhabditis japonica TaxID=281687 RepID=A0A8R1HJX1_CAEJA